MATRKRTTPLKAKTARRTAPKRKARKRAQKETCPVLLAMEEARQLSRNHRLISEGWERQSKARQECKRRRENPSLKRPDGPVAPE
jgi:hypothetical protein